MKSNLKGSIMLVIATVIWGTAFVFQEEAAEFIGSFTLNCMRSIVGAVVLIPVALIMKQLRVKKTGIPERLVTKTSVLGGICCGIALAIAANLQQIGIVFNAEMAEGDSGKAGFITAMYIIFVPIASVFGGKKLRFSMIAAVLLGVLGLYFISVKDGFTVSSGDIYLLLCAVAFTGHIMVVDHFVQKADGVTLSLIQFVTAAVISGVLMFVFDRDTLSFANILSAAVPILFCGVMSSGVAYTLQIVGQKYSEATVASLIMSLESLFCMVAACAFYAKLPTLREGIGCVIMLFAIFVVETPFADRIYAKIFKKKANQ
ncbi:MAG: DMT family transporter [Clostridia bacterium]|nr:DMT family transporter [Clostridia bacterium]